MQFDAPFPWFGGKRKVAAEVWARFGDVKNYVEPFFGSGAVLLRRPEPWSGTETINDLDGYVANFWRAVKHAPEETAQWADNPVNENDLHARHAWLLQYRESLRPRLEGNPEWYDAQIAGWWAWGMSCWIGSGFCSGNGPWRVIDGQLTRLGNSGQGVNRKRVHLGNSGRGVNRQLVHLGGGRGVNRQLVHLGNSGQGLREWFKALAERLRYVRVCSGDWSRVCGPSITFGHGVTGVFLDPPYSESSGRDSDLYREDSEDVARLVCEWAIKNGKHPLLRIALCGYEGEHNMPSDWTVHAWTACGGYANQSAEPSGNRTRERIWFSPSCLIPSDGNRRGLFEAPACI